MQISEFDFRISDSLKISKSIAEGLKNICVDDCNKILINMAADEINKLVDMLDEALFQRDEARRELCESDASIIEQYNYKTSPQEVAKRRGWHCFKENSK